MKKILMFLGAMAITTSAFAYKVKPEAADLSRYEIPKLENEIKAMNIKFDKFGKIVDAPATGFYNFATLEKDGKVVGYVGMTHVKSYNKYEPLLVEIDKDGKIADVSLPGPNAKHTDLQEKKFTDRYVGKTEATIPMDGLAGSTFSVNSINGEIKNVLRAFEMNKKLITE